MEDDKDEFVNLVNSLTYEIEDLNLWTYMYAYDAVNCAAAILSGDTSGKLNFEGTVSVVEPTDSSPLHQAAWYSAVNIIKLLVDRGESADINIRIDCINWVYSVKDALPLSMALKSAWRLDSFGLHNGHEYCLFKLIVKLCLSRKRENLETIRVLARNTNTKELDQEFVKYIKDGGTRYLCALLMAGCRLLPASPLRSVDEIPSKEELLQVFHIFDTIGDKLSAYVRMERSEIVTEEKVTAEIASLFRAADLPVTSLDVSPSDNVPFPRKSKGVFSVDHLIRPWGSVHFPAFHLEKFTVPVPRPSFPQASSSFGYTSRGFSTHSALPLEAPSVDGKNLVNVVKNIKIGKRYGFLATALRRVGRFS